MSIYLRSNAASLNALHHLNRTGSSLNKSLEKLASGFKINTAADGAGSLLASENLRSQIRGSDVAMTNVQQGLSMLQTADGAMQQINDHLQSMREIALAASNSTTTAAQFTAYQADYAAHSSAITAIANNTRYGSTQLLDGTTGAVTIQAGTNAGQTITLTTAFTDNTANGLTVNTTTIGSVANAQTRLGEVDAALGVVASRLATVGGFENQMNNQLSYLSVYKENVTAAEASIRNTDVAAETANLARYQIMQQAGAFALATANQQGSIALRLLQ